VVADDHGGFATGREAVVLAVASVGGLDDAPQFKGVTAEVALC